MKQTDRTEDRKKFIRLAEKRVTKTLQYINLIGNLSNPSNYSYKPQDVERIFAALRSEIDENEKLFLGQKKERIMFSLMECENDQ